MRAPRRRDPPVSARSGKSRSRHGARRGLVGPCRARLPRLTSPRRNRADHQTERQAPCGPDALRLQWSSAQRALSLGAGRGDIRPGEQNLLRRPARTWPFIRPCAPRPRRSAAPSPYRHAQKRLALRRFETTLSTHTFILRGSHVERLTKGGESTPFHHGVTQEGSTGQFRQKGPFGMFRIFCRVVLGLPREPDGVRCSLPRAWRYAMRSWCLATRLSTSIFAASDVLAGVNVVIGCHHSHSQEVFAGRDTSKAGNATVDLMPPSISSSESQRTAGSVGWYERDPLEAIRILVEPQRLAW